MKIKIAVFLLAVCWQTAEGDGKVNTSWSFFLGNLSSYLSGPTIQLDIKKYLVNDLKDWGNCSKKCRVVRNMPERLTKTLKYINDSYPRDAVSIAESASKKVSQTFNQAHALRVKRDTLREIKKELVETLKFVQNYRNTTELIKMLESSHSNFTYKTLKMVESEMVKIRDALLQTGCDKLYLTKQDHCIESFGNGPPTITKENFRDFLYILKKENNKTFHNFICWANVELAEKQVMEVKLVLALNLKDALDNSGSCNGNRTIFSGNIVRISDTHLNNLKPCSSKNESDDEVVQIMASDTIYIDEDIDFIGRKLLLAIMAPTVVVVGDRNIWLSGNDESSRQKLPRGLESFNLTSNPTYLHRLIKKIRNEGPAAISKSMGHPAVPASPGLLIRPAFPGLPPFFSLRNYFNETIDSPHGVPGLPGHTGGSFFGLANVFENASKLKIMSRGGRGGYGQHGAHGSNGKFGRQESECKEKVFPYSVDEECKNQHVIWNDGDGEIKIWPSLQAKGELSKQSGKISATFTGTFGTDGVDGGNGGAGGSGGNPGQIQIITLHRNDSFTKYAYKGETGAPGLAGSGGNGGRTPEHNVEIKIKIKSSTYTIQARRRAEYFANGKDGIPGNNTQGQVPPSPAIDINTNLDPLITDYRKMLKKSLETYIPKDKIFNHLMGVMKQNQIVGNCSTISVVNELLEYEDSFYKLHDKLNYTLIYSTLLNYTETKVERVEERDDKKALHYTYTAILSKLHAIKNHREEKYIANLNNFLNMFVEKLNRYKEKKREIAIIEESDRYKEEIDKQIEDANNVVSNSIMPKLEEIFAQIDRDLEELKREVDQKEQELLEQRKKLQEQKEKMKKNFLARLFGNILKLVGSVVSLLGPIGMVAGTAMQVAGSLVKKFGVDETAYAKPHFDQLGVKLEGYISTFDAAKKQKRLITKDIDEALNTFTKNNNEFDGEHNRAKQVYESVKGQIDSVKDTFTHIKSTYETAIKDLNEMKTKVNAFGDLTNDIYKQCRTVYQKLSSDISLASETANNLFNKAKEGWAIVMKGKEVAEKAFDFVQKGAGIVKNALTFVTKGFQGVSGMIGKFAGFAVKGINIVQNAGTMFSEMQEDRAQMEEIDRALAENQKSIDAIRKYREGIDEHMKPMLEGMKNTVREFPKMCEGKSEAQLMTTGWQVDQFLDKIISIMTQMTKEFQIGESFKTTITSIKEGVSLMTNIFRKIQDYGDKKKLSNHMVNLQLAGSEIQINNPELRNVTIRLSAAIEANLLLFDYRVWIKQIRLFVFPLPDTYLQTFKVPTAFESDDAHTLEGYTTNAIKAVERFRAQYIESHVYINKFDKLKHRAFFYNDTQMGPFFVWKNKNHKRAIARLFAGESVVFEALTMRSGMNALKFRRIDLVIRTNKKNQTLLNQILKNFMVRMKHIGNNYYNCDKITYVATVVGQVFKFSYQYINREPVDINVVYDKILHGDYMLSPYTTWYIKLINADRKNYKLLREFRRDVDIELSGEGEYFEDKSEVCEDDLSEYYQTKDQFKKKKPKVYEECPARAMVEKGLLCCEYNSTFDSRDKEWCRAIVRKPETLDRVHNTSEDKYYYYYDRYFRKSALSADELKTKFRATCSLHHGNPKCIEAFKNRQAYRPWFFYDDRAGGPFSRSYLYCSKKKCLARIEKALGPLTGLRHSNENAKYYFYAKQFDENTIQAQDRSKFERCSPSNADCAPAFENSNLLNFVWEPLPEEFQKKVPLSWFLFNNYRDIRLLQKHMTSVRLSGSMFN